MAGNTDNVAVWSEADVLIGPLTAVTPADGVAFTLTGGDAWAFAGILDGAAGFGETQSSESTAHNGWGYGEIATTRKNLTIMRTFTALEDNAETLGLRYDASGVTFTGANYTGDLAGRDLQAKFRVAFETRSGATIKRYITKNFAQVDSLGDVSETEDNLAALPVTLKIYPEIVDGQPVYWEVYKGPVVTP